MIFVIVFMKIVSHSRHVLEITQKLQKIVSQRINASTVKFNMLTFNKKYFGLAVSIFIIEVCIALFVRDRFFRPYVGDVLVVILIYCFMKAFLRWPTLIIALIVLVFAFSVELLQFFNIVDKLGLEKSKVAGIVIGSSFSWLDLVAYLTGVIIIVIVESFGLQRDITS